MSAMKVVIHKVSADGEQVSIEVPVDRTVVDQHVAHKTHLRESPFIAAAFDLIDARLLEMNKRIMASNVLVRKLPADAQFALNNVLDVLHGKAGGPATEEILAQAKAEAEAQQVEMERLAAEEVNGAQQGGSRRKKVTELPVGAE